ncbi:uncharacterized protein BDV17DRAFT_287635 [Aspergillus undulatus]|uniref:uncharacterized protein n=1 Tax=Aspergillus undulatus TaxID=1810928 RepID=UPI003CCDD158
MATETNLDYEILPSHLLAQAPAAHKWPLLFVNMTDITADEEAKIVGFLRQSCKDSDDNGPTASIQLWHPPNSALLQSPTENHRYALKRIYKDSKANIYSVAVLAHQAGYDFFFVADDYAKREIRDELDPSEKDQDEMFNPQRCFVVLVNIKSLVLEDGTEDKAHIRVFATRFAIGKKTSTAILMAGQKQDPDLLDVIGTDQYIEGEQFFQGVELHDPSRPVFAPNTATMTGHEEFRVATTNALSENTPLPTELIDQIVDLLYDDTNQRSKTPSVFRRKDLNIFLLFPSCENEILVMQTRIQQQVDTCIVDLQKAHEEKKQQNGDSDNIDDECATNGDNDEDDHHGVDDSSEDSAGENSEVDYGSGNDHDGGEDGELGDNGGSDAGDNSEGDGESEEDEDSSPDPDSDTPYLEHEGGHAHGEIKFPAKLTVRLIPWRYDHVANRFDIEWYRKLVHGRYVCPVNFLLAPINPDDDLTTTASNLKTSPFGSVYHGAGDFSFISRSTIEPMVRYALAHHCHMHRAVELRKEIKEKRRLKFPHTPTEILHQPELPFYPISQLWGTVGHSQPGTAVIPVFFVKGSFTSKQLKKIMTEVETEGEMDIESDLELTKSCRMIPFTKGNTDIDSIWKLFGELNDEAFHPPYFLADEKTADDLTLLAINPDVISWISETQYVNTSELPLGVGDPNLKGLDYGRIDGRDAFIMWQAINDRTVIFDDFFGHEGILGTYPRPNLPGFSV